MSYDCRDNSTNAIRCRFNMITYGTLCIHCQIVRIQSSSQQEGRDLQLSMYFRPMTAV